MGSRQVGDSKWVYDKNARTDAELIDELWNEVIDYILALRQILEEGGSPIADAVLTKHGKKESE